MTDAPERIWLLPDSVEGFDADGALWALEGPCSNDVEYVRADLARAKLKAAKAMAEALAQADAAITREINPSNYSHDDVCQLNDEAMEAVGIMQAALAAWDAAQKGSDDEL